MNIKRFSLAYLILCGVATFLCAVIPSSVSLAAESTSAWNESGVKIVDSNREYTSEDVDKYMGAHGRQTCEGKVIPIDSHYSESDCWYTSVFGDFSDYGNVWKPYDNEFAGYMGPSANTAVVPSLNPSVLLEFVPLEDGGYQLNFRSVFSGLPGIYTQIDDGPTFYNWMTPPASTFKHEDGSPYVVDGDVRYIHMWYDASGRYLLIADQNIGAVTRVDLATLKMLTVSYVDADVSSKFASFDITSDGKKLIVNTFGQAPQLIHLDMCSDDEVAYVSEPLTCEVTPLGTELEEFGVDSYSGDLAIFKDNTTIEWFGNVDGVGTNGRLYIYAPGTWQENRNYIAVGDSFASGEGAGNYYAGTDKDPDNMCHLSKKSYPYLITQGLASRRSVACSGAVIRNVVGVKDQEGTFRDNDSADQFNPDSKDSELGMWLPGVDMQTNYFNLASKPGIVTVSIGGNDVGFKRILEDCGEFFDTCFDNESDREGLVRGINNQYRRLVEAYVQIRKSAALGAKIYIIGYPEAIKEGDTYCGDRASLSVPFNKAERSYLVALTRYINLTIEHATAEAGVSYVDVSGAFEGHELCGEVPFLLAVNELKLRFNIDDPISPQSFHPNTLGHKLLAESIAEQTNQFTLDNPRATVPADITREDAVTIGVLESLWDPGETRELRYAGPPTDSLLLQGSPEDFQLGNGLNLQGGGHYVLEMHSSDPVRLDEATADENGVVTFHFTIPEDATVGQHTFVVTGPSQDGGTVEIRMPFFVAHTYEDWDGDGIRNEDQACPYITKDPDTGKMSREWCIDEDGVSIFETPEREDNEPVTTGVPGERVTGLQTGTTDNSGGSTIANDKEDDSKITEAPSQKSAKESPVRDVPGYILWPFLGVALILIGACLSGIYYIKHRRNND